MDSSFSMDKARIHYQTREKEPKIFLVGPVVGLIVKIVAEVIKKAVYEKILPSLIVDFGLNPSQL